MLDMDACSELKLHYLRVTNFFKQPKALPDSKYLAIYEQIPIVLHHGHHRAGVYCFLSAAGDHRHEYNRFGSGESLTDSIGDPSQECWRGKTESVKDRGLSI
jgi:hypothetical protein